MKKLITILLVSIMAMATVSAEAGNKRMGSGKSVGQQSSNVTKKQAAPPAQVAPAPAQPTPVAAQPSRPWGAMLGGLAAGLGLAWLASSLGMGEAFGNIMMALLFGMIVLAVIGWFMRRRMMSSSDNLAYQGADAAPAVNQPTRFQGGSMIGSALAPVTTWNIPSDFDVVGFESAAKTNFVALQAAWDRADMATLSNMMTDDMLKEIQQQIAQRNAAEQHKTDVATLQARLLGIEETDTNYMASIEFTGMIRDTADAIAEPFEEVWNMTKSKVTNSGWMLAGIQVK